MTPLTFESRTMDAEGAELRVSGGPFPPGTFEHLRDLLNSLHAALEPPPKVERSVPMGEVDDVLWRSALAEFEENAAEAEAGFAQREASIDSGGAGVPNQNLKVAVAIERLRDAIEAAVFARARFYLTRDE